MSNRRHEDGFDETHIGSRFTAEEREFLMAIDRYQTETGRRFLSWHEVLRLLKSLGYRRVAEPCPRRRRTK